MHVYVYNVKHNEFIVTLNNLNRCSDNAHPDKTLGY